MTLFIKTMKIHYVLKGINENPQTRITKKRSRQQNSQSATSSFYLDFTDTFCKMYEIPAARVIRRGPPGSTIIILKEIIRLNNHLTRGPPRFLPTRGPSRRGVLPPLRRGKLSSIEPPALPIPSYPALCLEDTIS